jgi:hypothetical protein
MLAPFSIRICRGPGDEQIAAKCTNLLFYVSNTLMSLFCSSNAASTAFDGFKQAKCSGVNPL